MNIDSIPNKNKAYLVAESYRGSEVRALAVPTLMQTFYNYSSSLLYNFFLMNSKAKRYCVTMSYKKLNKGSIFN